MFGDHWVPSRDEKEIEDIANRWRELAWIVFGSDYFNLVDFVNKVFQRRRHRDQRLTIKFLAKETVGPPAKVTFKPLTLHVRVDVWEAARQDEAWARYIIAHECGHLILHDHEAQGFSSPDARRLPAEAKDRSAEWQADKLADFLIAPTVIVERQYNAHDVAIRCGIPNNIAERRLAEVAEFWRTNGRLHEMERCDHCFGFEATRIDSRVRCLCGRVTAMPM